MLAGEAALGRYVSSPGKIRRFCTGCGSPVFNELEALPDVLSLRCGLLDGAPPIQPEVQIFVDARAAWMAPLPGIACEPGPLPLDPSWLPPEA